MPVIISDAEVWVTNRSNRTENVGFIASSCINIIGGIQPSKMKLIINEDSLSDGFAMRFLFVELPAVPLYKTRDKPNKDLTNNMLKLFILQIIVHDLNWSLIQYYYINRFRG